MKITLAVLALFALASTADAAFRTQDSDLAPRAPGLFRQVPTALAADEVTSEAGPLTVKVLREDHGKLTPVAALPFRAPGSRKVFLTDADGVARLDSCAGGKTRIEAELTRDGRFDVTNGSDRYKISAEIPCNGSTELRFKADSDGGQALGIWQVALRAEAKLASEVDMGFWATPLAFVWPDPMGADYYSAGEVHISRGDYWDVVGHEMGHGIYDLGSLGLFGGGPHKIDECYSEELALSEGWASFFSAWVSLDPADADARFEYMVPRRAPIRFENIPADVCRGETNEWRVIGFFWDLVDTHDDGEESARGFKTMWDALLNSRVPSASRARARLESAGIGAAELQGLWTLNFGSPGTFGN